MDGQQFDVRNGEAVRLAKYTESIDSVPGSRRTSHYRMQMSHSRTFRLDVSRAALKG